MNEGRGAIHAALRHSGLRAGEPGHTLWWLARDTPAWQLLPSIPGHAHTLDAFGYPTCGCRMWYPGEPDPNLPDYLLVSEGL